MRRALGCLVLVLSNCAARYDVSAPEVPKSADQAAEQAFRQARAKHDQGDVAAARQGFGDFIARFPDDPLAPVAALELGRIELQGDRPEAARPRFEAAATSRTEGIARAGRFWQAVADARLGQCDKAETALAPFAGQVDKEPAAAALGALAECRAQAGQPRALELLAQVWESGTPADQTYAWQRAGDVASKLTLDDALAAWTRAQPGSLARGALGARLSALLAPKGDPRAPGFAAEGADAARKYQPPDDAAPGPDGSDRGARPDVVGVVLEQAGAVKALGEQALRGALVAAGAVGEPQRARTQVVTRAAAAPADVTAAVGELVSSERAIAIVGPIDRRAVTHAVQASDPSGTAVLSLAITEDVTGHALRLLHGPAARARALAGHAKRVRVASVGVLASTGAYGKRVADAFVDAAKSEGVTIAVDLRYDAKETSFTKQARVLKARGVDAVFVGDTSSKLELIAPALAAADLWATPRGDSAGPKRRAILLLSTAEGLSPRLLQTAGRYVQGAVLGASYWADEADERQAELVGRYRQAYGEDPGQFAAAAWDAVRAVRAAVERGAKTAGDVRKALVAGGHQGALGTMRFSESGERVDAPRLYVVEGERIRTVN